jgi:hypothetical protein
MRQKLIRAWLAADDESVLRYSRDGLPAEMIARRLRRTPRAVKHRLVVLARRPEPEDGAEGTATD